jgi:hypothetical protein
MHLTLLIESAVRGLLFVNGQFCGPMEREGQTFPAGRNAEIYIQLFPFGEAAPLAAMLILRDGKIERLEPEVNAFALYWPDGVIQLELRMQDQAQEPVRETAVSGVLLRYLMLRLAGDPQAMRLWLKPQDEQYAPGISIYSAAVPLRFAPQSAPQRFDDRAGLVRPVLPNAAVVDTALAATVPAGQGKRLIEQIQILPTYPSS